MDISFVGIDLLDLQRNIIITISHTVARNIRLIYHILKVKMPIPLIVLP